jgi:ankyrin repeat protein
MSTPPAPSGHWASALLVDHDVDVNARDTDGQTALAVARAAGKTKAAQFLEGIGAE